MKPILVWLLEIVVDVNGNRNMKQPKRKSKRNKNSYGMIWKNTAHTQWEKLYY